MLQKSAFDRFCPDSIMEGNVVYQLSASAGIAWLNSGDPGSILDSGRAVLSSGYTFVTGIPDSSVLSLAQPLTHFVTLLKSLLLSVPPFPHC